MNDPTDSVRRALVSKINFEATERTDLEARYGQVWNTQELARDFEVMEFAAPFAIVKRKADNRMGSVLFQHHPPGITSLFRRTTENNERGHAERGRRAFPTGHLHGLNRHHTGTWGDVGDYDRESS